MVVIKYDYVWYHTHMQRAIELLTGLGLTKREAQVYIALSELGASTAYAVAKHSGLKRPSVYLLLDELRKKDLVAKVPHPKNQVFIAKDPVDLLETYLDKIARAQLALPELLSKRNSKKEIKTRLFEGEHGMEAALAYRRTELRSKEMLAFYGVPRARKKLSEMYHEHAQALENQDTYVRVFLPKDADLKQYRKKVNEYGQEARYLPKRIYLPRASIEIAYNFAKIYLHTASQVLIIEGEEFPELLRQLFEMLWKDKTQKSSKK